MTTTPNYSFTIAEGTDTVNLLTQSYPNFTSLDSILKSIEDTGITVAVATKVGTVFQIVRNNTDLAVMRFVATANYAAGDTFTVDGVAVTATAMNGTALPAGAFVINQSVEAILNGAVLTIVGVAGASAVAASDVTYDNTGSGLTATDVQDAIDEVYGDIPTGFAASAITYDNSGSGLTATDVQDAIDELASGSSTPAWTSLGSVTGTTPITLPVSYTEMYAAAVYNTGGVDETFGLLIPAVALGAGTTGFRTGQTSGANNQSMYVKVSQTEIFLANFTWAGSDKTSGRPFSVWYR